MSAQNRPFVIRDPVHGYLKVAAHERLVVDDRITQRLRRVNQTGLAELVFPEARTSRFVHSMGAMHLASSFLVSSVENSPASVQEELRVKLSTEVFSQVREKMSPARDSVLPRPPPLELEDMDQLTTHSDASTDQVFGSGLRAAEAVLSLQDEKKRDELRRLLCLAESGLRLAALFHDLGHLPLSHDFEYALEDYAVEATNPRSGNPDQTNTVFLEMVGTKPHEAVGHHMATLVLRGLVVQQFSDFNSPYNRACVAAFQVANNILLHAGDENLWGWLHSLVDGELDVDRADYLLRDGRALGLDFATYDLERLVENLTVIKTDDGGLRTAVYEKGISAVESFFLTRSRSNQVFVRHHKAAQIAAAFRYCTSSLLISKPEYQILKDLRLIAKMAADAQNERTTEAQVRDLLNRFAEYTDGWWLGEIGHELMARRASATPADRLFCACAELLLYRQRTLKSAWKREGDFSNPKDMINKLNTLASDPGDVNLSALRYQLARSAAPILVVFHKFTPYKTEDPASPGDQSEKSALKVVPAKGEHVPLTDRSPLVKSLRASWVESVHVHAFVLVDDSRSAEQIVAAITEAADGMRGGSGQPPAFNPS